MSDGGSLDESAIRGLAQFRPFEGGAEALVEVHAELVEGACQSNGGSFANSAACQEFIKQTWKIEMEAHEVQGARQHLERLSRVEKSAPTLALTSVRKTELDERRQRWECAESTAMEEWEVAVRREYPFLETESIAELKSQLRPWLERVIAAHGAEASLLLYPGHERRAALDRAISETNLRFLPDCDPKLNRVRASAFWLLVREPTASQREFLGRLLNTGFYLTVLSIDPKANHLVKAEAKRTTLYLDTNFLYALLDVGGTTEGISAKRLMELCRDLGFSLRVTPWTVDELRTSIAKNRADAERVHQSRKSAQVMAEVSGEKGFGAAFWRERKDRNIDPRTFFGKYEHFMQFLEEFGIKEHPEGCSEAEGDLERIRVYASPLEAMYGVGVKERVVIEHDAKMRILIEDLRRGDDWGSFSDVGYWVLTESTKLPTYARLPIATDSRPRHPFCILSSSWAQIVRAMVPRTDDLNDMIIGLLASPYVGYKSAATGDHLTAVERTVARIDTLRDVPAAVAVAMVKDETMASNIAGETDPDEVNRLVEEGLTQKAEELAARLDRTAEERVKADQERLKAEERAREADAQENASAAERAEAERQARDAKERAEAATRDKEKVVEGEASLEEKVKESEARHREEEAARVAAEGRERRYRNILAFAGALLLAAASCALLLTGTVHGTTASVVVVAATMVCVYLIVRLVSQELAKEVVYVISVAAAAAALVSAVAAPDDSGDQNAGKVTNGKSP
jgi:VIT1/CCC1 family predicted Fe2+/Mn2+ transporter